MIKLFLNGGFLDYFLHYIFLVSHLCNAKLFIVFAGFDAKTDTIRAINVISAITLGLLSVSL